MSARNSTAAAKNIKSLLKSNLKESSTVENVLLKNIYEALKLKEIENAQDLTSVCAIVLEIDRSLIAADIEIGVTDLIKLSKYDVNVENFDNKQMLWEQRQNNNLYKLQLSESINTAWYIITGGHLDGRHCLGKILIGLGGGKHLKSVAKIAVKQFNQLYELLYWYHQFLCTPKTWLGVQERQRQKLIKKGQQFANPSFDLMVNFLKSDMAQQNIDENVLRQIMENSDININGDGKIDWNNYLEMVNDERLHQGASSGVSCHVDELKYKSLESGLKELLGKAEVPCMTFAGLKQKLASSNNGIGLDENGQLIMETSNWNILRNSPIVSYMFFNILMR